MNQSAPETRFGQSPEAERPGSPVEPTAEDPTTVDTEQHEAVLPNPPSIYVASLADYNAGHLHGTWIDATQDLETIDDQITSMLNRSQEPGAEEIAIHDYEHFGAWQLSEHESLENVKTVADAIAEHGEAVTHWIDYLGERPDRAIASFEEAYLGNWETMRDYAENLAEDIGVEVTVDPPSWQHYAAIDYDAVARDMDIEMYSSRDKDGSLHVFDPGRIE